MRRCRAPITSKDGMLVTYCMRNYGHNGDCSRTPDQPAERVYMVAPLPKSKKCDVCGGPYLACECCSTSGFHV